MSLKIIEQAVRFFAEAENAVHAWWAYPSGPSRYFSARS
jgi:hypothetical protein